jgi:hypothetical protein
MLATSYLLTPYLSSILAHALDTWSINLYLLHVYRCLCHAFLLVYHVCAMGCATLVVVALSKRWFFGLLCCLCSCIFCVSFVLILVCCAAFCGPSLRAGRGIVLRLSISNVGSSHHGRGTEGNSTSSFSWLHSAVFVVPSYDSRA